MVSSVDTAFVLFGQQHLTALAVIAAAAIVVPLTARFTDSDAITHRIGVSLAVILVAHEAFKVWFHGFLYDEPVAQYLPLHICGAAALLMAFVLAFRHNGAFEVGYFWGLIGSMQALATPDIRIGYPSLVFLAFFLGHGLVIVSVIFAIVAYGFRPRFGSVIKTIKVTLIYMAVIAPLNYLLDANYLYLRHKPVQSTIIDFLGPWPWYILSLMLVGVVLCLLYYLPFAVLKRR